jgi:hypothetical protein
MENLAPDITRQRLLIEGFFTIDVDEDVIRAYFERLTTEMQLRTYGAPTIFAPEGDGRAENQGYDAFVPPHRLRHLVVRLVRPTVHVGDHLHLQGLRLEHGGAGDR